MSKIAVFVRSLNPSPYPQEARGVLAEALALAGRINVPVDVQFSSICVIHVNPQDDLEPLVQQYERFCPKGYEGLQALRTSAGDGARP